VKIKLVKQYKCDFCGKKGLGGWQMKKHEKHCTLNPNRICRMCNLIKINQIEMRDLLLILPESIKKTVEKNYGIEIIEDYTNKDEIKKAIEIIRDKTECPMCVFSAIRQKGYCTPIFFDYKKEMAEFWSSYNNEQNKEDLYIY
jgi:hypothetical protein